MSNLPACATDLPMCVCTDRYSLALLFREVNHQPAVERKTLHGAKHKITVRYWKFGVFCNDFTVLCFTESLVQ